MRPSVSVPAPVRVRAKGAEPEDEGEDVRLAQTGGLLTATEGDVVGVIVVVGVTVTVGVVVGVGLPPAHVAVLIAICAGVDPAAENTFSVNPSVPAPERILVLRVSISILAGAPPLEASGFILIVATFVEVVISLSILAPVVSTKEATPPE